MNLLSPGYYTVAIRKAGFPRAFWQGHQLSGTPVYEEETPHLPLSLERTPPSDLVSWHPSRVNLQNPAIESTLIGLFYSAAIHQAGLPRPSGKVIDLTHPVRLVREYVVRLDFVDDLDATVRTRYPCSFELGGWPA